MTSVLSARPSTGPYHDSAQTDGALIDRYEALVGAERLNWFTRYRKVRQLGAGGQGVVFLSERQGSDGFTLPVALKVFSPQNYRDRGDYEDNMRRIARVAARVAMIQHDNVLDVHTFITALYVTEFRMRLSLVATAVLGDEEEVPA